MTKPSDNIPQRDGPPKSDDDTLEEPLDETVPHTLLVASLTDKQVIAKLKKHLASEKKNKTTKRKST